MTYEEYMRGEPDDEGDIIGEFLIEEPPDIDFVMLPKLDVNMNEVFESYYKLIKQCRKKADILYVLEQFYNLVADYTTLQNDIEHLQQRTKEIEMNVELYKQQY